MTLVKILLLFANDLELGLSSQSNLIHVLLLLISAVRSHLQTTFDYPLPPGYDIVYELFLDNLLIASIKCNLRLWVIICRSNRATDVLSLQLPVALRYCCHIKDTSTTFSQRRIGRLLLLF